MAVGGCEGRGLAVKGFFPSKSEWEPGYTLATFSHVVHLCCQELPPGQLFVFVSLVL
jgi:hypothetical protein